MLEHSLSSGNVAVCVKDQDRKVLMQDDLCRSICGERTGQVCNDGCMQLLAADQQRQWRDWGCTVYSNSHIHGEHFDVSLICSSERIITFLQPLEEKYRAALAHYATMGLTEREQQIIGLIVRGRTNTQVCEELSITRATLRTHLNRAYAKLRDGGASMEFLPGCRTAEESAGAAA